ncbi:uncharacterized protein EV154DRAFT_307141 [Mucor mucedo]|uniref:uncharacterized protein n=1 Tax=Mucor mucedo TaxID=29922 RepID=UPI002221238F|nr:uncharacterized protein EV154DRAFT_307141 [Mucor mucedo]KAI7888541.1 hypothetical protein EV154DRAFT_307141 [Mucor mucedo]
MSNWSQLPTEVLTEIFKLLKFTLVDKLERSRIFSQQMLVCKHWCRIGKTFLYKDVTMLSVKQQDTFLRCMTLYSTGMNQLVHSFKAFDESPYLKTEEDLGLILNALPNLQEFYAIRQKGRFFAKLLLELYSSSDRPTQLARIPDYYIELEDDVKIYQYAILALKKTLRYMMLPDWCVTPYRITTPLEDFKNLTYLELRLYHISQLVEIATIPSRCPTLTHLHIARDAKLQPMEGEQPITAMIDMGSIQPAFHIAMLKIDASVVTFSQYSMYMLMVLFPKLDSWFMYTKKDKRGFYQYDPISRKIPIEAWVEFLTYVDKIKSFYGLHLAISSLNQVLKEISSSTGFCKEISVRYNTGRLASDNQNDPIINILPSGIHNMHGTCDYEKHGTTVIYVQNNYISELPHVSLIEQIGFQLERLTLDLSSLFNHLISLHTRSVNDKKSMGRFINLIFKHCPVLRALVIRGSFLVFCDDNDIEAPLTSFKFLHLQQCLVLNRTTFMWDLSRRLPFRLEWMVIEQCNFSNQRNDLPHLNMPFTVLGCLFISRQHQTISNHLRMVIKITKASQNPLYYCLNDRRKLEKLSGQEAFEIYAKNEESSALQITCVDIEKLLIRAFGFSVLIFPKEEVEYMDGQDYINSTSEFRHIQV